jgi:hypothetical protein
MNQLYKHDSFNCKPMKWVRKCGALPKAWPYRQPFYCVPGYISEGAISFLTRVMHIYHTRFFYFNEGLIATLALEVLLLAWTESSDHLK